MRETQVLIAPRLVPRPLWGHSACKLLAAQGREDDWRALRSVTLAEADNTCQACGHRQRRWMVCDEDWRYDAMEQVASLTALRILCPACDAVCHLGHTAAARGQEASDRAVRHMARVNGTSIDEALFLIDQEWERWRQLSSIQRWVVRVTPGLALRFPALRIVEIGDERRRRSAG